MPRTSRWTLLGVALPALALAQAPASAPSTAAPAPTSPPAPSPAAAAPAPAANALSAPAAPAPATAAPSAAKAPAAAAPSGPQVAKLLAEADALWPDRDAPGKIDAIKAKLDQAEKLAPRDYQVLWRLSRWYFWVSDDPKMREEEKSRLGKIGWEYGDRATQANPEAVEGWFYATGGIGNYSLGLGVVKALFQGIEGKFLDRLKRAEQIDPGYDSGGIETTWGRYYYELPWPKYDGEKCERFLRKALRKNPKNVRAKVYLAELFIKEDYRLQARKQLEEALALVPGAYDPPEERRYLARARELLAGMKKN